MITDHIKISWKEIKRRKLRSFLTLIGIIIGMTAVSSLITLGQGLENAISGQFDSLGNCSCEFVKGCNDKPEIHKP